METARLGGKIDDCSIDSGSDVSDYVYIYYTNYYGDGSKGEDVDSYYKAIVYQWNEFMSVYKMCQSCRLMISTLTTMRAVAVAVITRTMEGG